MEDWRQKLEALKNSGSLPQGNNIVVPEKGDTEMGKTSLPTLKIIIDKNGRKGKTATIIEGFDPEDPEIDNIAATLKKKLATGGSVRDGEILIQGERKEETMAILRNLGYKIK